VTSDWCRYDAAAGRLVLTLHVQPNARKSALAGVHGDALKVKIAAPAADNEANRELAQFLGDTLGVSRSAIRLRHGTRSRRKVVEIAGGSDLVARARSLA